LQAGVSGNTIGLRLIATVCVSSGAMSQRVSFQRNKGMSQHVIAIPTYTAPEKDLIINSIMSLKKEKIQAFLEMYGLDGVGTKAIKRGNLMEALDSGEVHYAQVVAYLDQIEPWGKQHVFLYDGPSKRLGQNLSSGRQLVVQ
jgi:hypothetical protein